MSRGRKAVKASKLPLSGKFDVRPEIETLAALHVLSAVWGGTLGHAVTAVLDTCVHRALQDAVQLQALIGQLHPEYEGAPLLSLPRDVFVAGCRAQDLANSQTQGRA